MSAVRIDRAAGLALGLVLASAGAVSPALAQPSPAKEGAARALFDDARTLFGAGKTAEACQKFAASYGLDAKGATLLNLAICHEREGKIASAWTEFSEARAQASRDGNSERAKLAEERASELAKQVPQLRITFAERAPGLVVRLDGKPIAAAALDAQIPIDPGQHDVEVVADAKKPWRDRVTAAPFAIALVRVPIFVSAETSPAVPPGDVATRADERAPSDGSTQRTIAFVALGTAVVSAGFGVAFGVRAIGKRSDAEDACAAGRCEEGRSINDDGVTSAWIANGAVGAALVLGAVGVLLFVTAPKRNAMAATPSGLVMNF